MGTEKLAAAHACMRGAYVKWPRKKKQNSHYENWPYHPKVHYAVRRHVTVFSISRYSSTLHKSQNPRCLNYDSASECLFYREDFAGEKYLEKYFAVVEKKALIFRLSYEIYFIVRGGMVIILWDEVCGARAGSDKIFGVSWMVA